MQIKLRQNLTSTLLSSAALFLLSGAARAEAPIAHHLFNIPAEDAALAFRDFAQQSGRQVLFAYETVAGRRTTAVKGDFPDQIVLERLCDQAGLSVISRDGDTVTLGLKPVAAGGTDAPPVQEVVVTAAKRVQGLQSVPFSVSALGQRDLSARGASSVEQAIRYIPGVSFSSNGENSGTYSIRGVSTSSSVGNTQSPVALYIDDINVLDPNYPKITTNLRLFDIDRVEVLRGPQGTLFGSGSLGGAIRVITKKPDATKFEAETEETLSSTDDGGVSYALNAMINAPLIEDQLALRVVGYYQHDSGYVDNTTREESDANHALSEGARVELKWTPVKDFSLTASALFENDRPHDAAYTDYATADYKFSSYVPNQNLNNTRIFSLTGTYDMHWASLTSITTYADRDESAQLDFTGRAITLLGISNPSTVTDAGPSRTFSQEVRLASPDTGRFRWLIGGIYLDNRHVVDENVIIPGSQAIFGGTSDDIAITNSDSRIREAALFGEVSYDIVPSLTATVGLRVFHDDVTLAQTTGGPAQGIGSALRNIDETAATPKFNLSYKVAPTITAYVQAAEGYRVGQVNVAVKDPLSGQVIPPSYDPDKLWNYEVGAKTAFFDGRLIVNADLYYIDWRDIQLNQYTLVSGLYYISNAGDAAIKGAELEVKAQPFAGLELGGSLGLNDSRLTSVAPGVSATKGDRLPGSPRAMAGTYGQYTYPLGPQLDIFGRIDVQYVGKEFSDLRNATSLTYGDYGEVNLRAGVDWRRYTLSVFMNNAADGDARISALPVSNVPVAIRQRPLTVGLTLDAKF